MNSLGIFVFICFLVVICGSTCDDHPQTVSNGHHPQTPCNGHQPQTAYNAHHPQTASSGRRVRAPNTAAIYLVLDGYRRHVPNPDTYNKLFRDWNGVDSMDVEQIPLRPPLTNGAILARSSSGAPHVYLVSNGKKRWIINPTVFNRYHFDWSKVVVVPEVVLAIVPEGANIA